ncbi:MAG TPA: sugar ABC transporter ATP-binding protein [Terrimicrobiaceae bacterium]|nr:sugar ABC transporter ATP-binding protein [Terrimicrobiaceae bacterium]
MMAAPSAALLEIRGLSKSFPGVKALQAVDFTVRRGEVHALMGENGAGKSTLIKVLTGVYPRDSGTIRFDGTEIDPPSPKAAEQLGVSTVYQEVNLIPHRSVAENICLGRQPTRFGLIRWRAVARRAEAALARVDLKLDVSQPLFGCSIAVQQLIAIARALDISAKLLVLDEPTSSLDEQEVKEFFSVIRKLRSEGMGIIFVTHFLDQVYAISDRITVLRDGRLVGDYETSKLPKVELVSRMIGKDMARLEAVRQEVDRSEPERGRKTFIEVRNFGRNGSIAPIEMTVAKGEIVGLAGLLGSGRTETARLLFGIDRPQTGEMLVEGRKVTLHAPRQAIREGFAFTPEDRKVEGIVPHLSVRENIILAMQARQGIMETIPRSRQEEIADKFIKALGIRTPGPEQAVMNLSGGNQQKVLLARWLATEPRFLILDEPTRGIDVGAKVEIEKLMHSLRAEGMSILFISSELEEVVRDSQRVIVLRDRAKAGELVGEEISQRAIMGMIAGHERGA